MKNIKKIRVFSIPTCPFCVVLKNYLKENGFEFEEIDISKETAKREELIKKTGLATLPVVEINGQLIVGFDKKKIDEILKIKK